MDRWPQFALVHGAVVIWLSWRDATHDPRRLVALASVAFIATLVLALMSVLLACESVALIDDGSPASGDGAEAGAFGSILALTSLVTTTAVVMVNALTVKAGRAIFASWIVAGVSPTRIACAVIMRSAICAVVGGFAAVPFAIAFAAPVSRYYTRIGFLADQPTADEVGFAATICIPSAVALTLLLTICASLPAALTAAATRPAQVLRESERDADRRSPATRWAIAAVIPVITVPPTILVLTVPGVVHVWNDTRRDSESADIDGFQRLLELSDVERAVGVQSTVSLSLVVAFAVILPLVARKLVIAWTRLMPASQRSTWHTARHAIAERVGTAAATLTISSLIIGLTVSIAGADDLVRLVGAPGARMDAASGHTHANLWWEVVATLGPAALVALVGSAAALTQGTTNDRRDASLLHDIGLGPGRMRRYLVEKTMIYAISAMIPAVVIWAVSLAIGVAVAIALGLSVSLAAPDPRPILAATLLVAVASGIALVVSTRAVRRL